MVRGCGALASTGRGNCERIRRRINTNKNKKCAHAKAETAMKQPWQPGRNRGARRKGNRKMRRTANTKTNRLEQRQNELDHMASQGWQIETIPEANAILCRLDRLDGKAESKAFKGTAAKPFWWYLFKSNERREAFIERRINDLKRVAEKACRKSPPAADHYMIGDVLYDSWGYDQTNIDWYQVTKVKGKSIWLRRVAENSSDAGNCSSGFTQPRRNEFYGEEIRKTVQPGGHVASPLRGGLYKWDGKPKYCSSYH